MSATTLVIGNYRYSSWSLRAWIALRMAGIDFVVERIALYQPDSKARILKHSAAGTVPILKHGGLVLSESLAICEYAAELAPQARLWPADRDTRALARSVATEMHGGFPAVRQTLPMNFGRTSKRTPALGDDARAQVARIESLWTGCRQRSGREGPFLFGHFTVADAMYAPVVSRFHTYCVRLAPGAQAYADAIWKLPAMKEWGAEAAREPGGASADALLE
ncbi:MAG TPA: glutathione S-transferase family protein [Myxococcota bacterium]|nr:glutathione S-transferase family protein [Myxococcota bacterium]